MDRMTLRRMIKTWVVVIFAIIASMAASYGWNGTATFFGLWCIAGLVEAN